jgi:glycosyltransferase involved in cell wall biosynthesis
MGMHWGWYGYDVPIIPHIRFHLAGNGSLTLSHDNPTPILNFCSRNFMPDEFHPSDEPKYWDVIAVGHCIPRKRHEDYLKALRVVFDARPETRALLLAPVPVGETRYALHLTEMINAMFSTAEQGRIDVMLPLRLPLRKLMPVSQTTVAELYRKSRVFIHTTAAEGNVRVLHEALLCGLPCVVRSDLAGCGHEFLTEKNSRYFATPEEAGRQILSLLEAPPDLVSERAWLAGNLTARHTLPRFTQTLRDFFGALGEPFEGTLEPGNYAQLLSSHTQNLPRALARSATQDQLASFEAALRYIALTLGEKVDDDAVRRLRQAWSAAQSKVISRKWVERFRRMDGRIRRRLRMA